MSFEILIIGFILFTETSGVFNNSVIVSVTNSLQKHFRSGSVIFLYFDGQTGGLPANSYIFYATSRSTCLLTTVVNGNQLNLTHIHITSRGNIPLIVLTQRGNLSMDVLKKISPATMMSNFKWLLFVDDAAMLNKFDNMYIPFDCQFMVAVHDNSKHDVVIYEIYKVSINLPLRRKQFGLWTQQNGLHTSLESLYHRRNNLEEVPINTITVPDPPSIVVETNDNNDTIVSGFYGEIWKIMEKTMNFKTKFFLSTHGYVSDVSCNETEDTTKKCIHMDAALDSFSLTSHVGSRNKYTMPLMFTRYKLFIKKPSTYTLEWNDFVRPFHSLLWISIVCTIIILSSFLTLCHRIGRVIGNAEAHGPPQYEFTDSLLYIFGAFCSQGHDITPQAVSCRIVYITSYLTSVVFVASYSAALISSLATSQVNYPFTDLKGLLKDKTYQLGVLKNSKLHAYFMNRNNELHYNLYLTKMVKDKENFPDTNLDGLQRVCSNRVNFVFMTIYENAMTLMNEVNCSIVMLPYSSYPITIAFALAPDSPYRGLFNYNLRLLRDGGIIHKHKIANWPIKTTDATSIFTRVDFLSIVPLLTVLLSTLIVSLLLLIAEKRYHQSFPMDLLKAQQSVHKSSDEDYYDSSNTRKKVALKCAGDYVY